MTVGILMALCALGVVMTLAADRREQKVLEWIGKPMAAVCFILVGLEAGALDSRYGQWVLAGLLLGAAGDVLLIPLNKPRIFLAGMNAFLLGHVAYVVAFAMLDLDAGGAATAGLVMIIGGIALARWLLPQTPEDFRLPVLSYLGVIGVMVVVAVSAVAAGAHWIIAAGAIGFALSDVSVARDRFIQKGFINRAWGLPLYFASQIMIALSVGLVAA